MDFMREGNEWHLEFLGVQCRDSTMLKSPTRRVISPGSDWEGMSRWMVILRMV